MSTTLVRKEDVQRKWYVLDAADKPLGRTAVIAANILRGKTKPDFTPNVDCGDYVIVVNASKIKLTGKKLDQKLYRYHTGYPGGLKEITYRKLMANKSEFAFKEAVRRMLPKGPLGYSMLKKLRVYAGPEHEQLAQKPEVLVLK